MTESVLISVAGGVLGTVLALWAFQTLASVVIPMLTPVGLPPFFIDASPDFRVIAVMAAVTLGTGVLFGLAPAFQVSKPDLHAAIKQGAQSTGGPRRGRLQGALVGVQVAMTMVLMVGVGLLLRGLTATQTIDPGFEFRNIAVATYDLLGGGYDPAEAPVFQRRLLEEVRALPGVEAAAQAITEPLNTDTEGTAIGLPTQDRSQFRGVDLNGVTPDYFDVVGIPIVRGRAFEDADMTDGSTAAIVTESTARNLWPGEEPIGQRLLDGGRARSRRRARDRRRGARCASDGGGQVEPYYLYLPAAPQAAFLFRLLVKSRTDFTSTAAAIRAAAERLDPGTCGAGEPARGQLRLLAQALEHFDGARRVARLPRADARRRRDLRCRRVLRRPAHTRDRDPRGARCTPGQPARDDPQAHDAPRRGRRRHRPRRRNRRIERAVERAVRREPVRSDRHRCRCAVRAWRCVHGRFAPGRKAIRQHPLAALHHD